MSRRRGVANKLLVWLAIALAIVWTLFPFYWALIYSVKPTNIEYKTVFVPFLEFHPTLEHWRWEWTERHEIDGLQDGLINSLIVALGTAVCCVAVGILTAIGLRLLRASGRGAGAMLKVCLIPRGVPVVAIVTPLYLLVARSQLHDTLTALVLVHSMLGLPLAVMVIDSAFREFPRDLVDAARLDGANLTRVAVQIVAPLTRPLLAGVGVLSFALSWNEYLLALTNYSGRAFTMPLSVAFLEDRDGVAFEHVGSHLVMIAIPPLLLALLTQRYLVRGLSLGMVREER